MAGLVKVEQVADAVKNQLDFALVLGSAAVRRERAWLSSSQSIGQRRGERLHRD